MMGAWIMIGLAAVFVIMSIPFLAWVIKELGCGVVIFGTVAAIIILAFAIYYHENISPLLPLTVLDKITDFVVQPEQYPPCDEGVKGWCQK